MSKIEGTIRIGDTIIFKNKIVYYGIPENNKRELKIYLDGQFVILLKYDSEEDARRNFDELNKLMNECLDYADTTGNESQVSQELEGDKA